MLVGFLNSTILYIRSSYNLISLNIKYCTADIG